MKPNLFISFSGGETSAYMTWWLLNEGRENFNEIVVAFANTGQEYEGTLVFIDRCQRVLGFPVVWLEGVQNHNERKSATHRIVDFNSADRKGKVFEDGIKKYGIPNQAFPHCTRSLKTTVLEDYARSIGWKKGSYLTAIGIRVDEIDRVSQNAEENCLVYPLTKMKPMTKAQINSWWSQQPFRLELTGYQGNCKWCWKKTLRKHYTLMKEDPSIFDFPDRMEKAYPHIGPEFRKDPNKHLSYRRTFFRGNKSTEDLRADYEQVKDVFEPYHDENQVFDHDLDVGGGCGESCEVYSDENLEFDLEGNQQ